ncbi:MAG: xylose isomerase [Flavobacteriales bacterium]|nr:xylose isomerase [Flavobacteriales bacterium]|tara:strand:+ start:427 stop:1278 length:852 start_codon:yes stop_codon:yes gene_type:complete
MIYVSSSCVKAEHIKDSVKQLVEAGFFNIELSGGTEPYPDLEKDLLMLQDKYNINYLCHNYFPPPQTPFVLNLASLDKEVARMSLDHCKNAIDLSQKLGAKKFAFHAGFLINIPIDQIGKKISKKDMFDRHEAIAQFLNNVRQLLDYSGDRIELYIENNVISEANFKEFDEENLFFFTHEGNLAESKGDTGINYLLDLAHLSVSCNSLGLNFKEELNSLINGTDYIHLSANDGRADLNWAITKDSTVYQNLKDYDISNKTITLETYADIDKIRESFQLIEDLR